MIAYDKERPVLAYVPNKGSSFGHATLPRNLPKIVPHLLHFFRDFTISPGPLAMRLDVYGATDFDLHDYSSECLQKAAELFGTGSKEGDLHIGPLGGVAKCVNFTWTVQEEDFQKALDFLVQGHPWPKQLFGPVAFSFSYDFMWRDPRTGLAFPEQESGYRTADGKLTSSLFVHLERLSYVQPRLMFPYELTDPRLYDLLSVITPVLPFKLCLKNFRRYLPLKKTGAYKASRIDPIDSARLSEFAK